MAAGGAFQVSSLPGTVVAILPCFWGVSFNTVFSKSFVPFEARADTSSHSGWGNRFSPSMPVAGHIAMKVSAAMNKGLRQRSASQIASSPGSWICTPSLESPFRSSMVSGIETGRGADSRVKPHQITLGAGLTTHPGASTTAGPA